MNRLPPGFVQTACRRLWRNRRTYAGGRELQLEGCAHAKLAFYMDLSGVLLHDAVGDRESKPGTFVLALLRLRLGGEERVVDTMEVLALDATARVLDAHQHTARAIEGRNLQSCILCSEHRVLCVQHKVQNHLLKLTLVAVNPREVRIEVRLNANLRCLELVLQQRNGIAKQCVQVDAGKLRAAGARKIQQPIHNLRRPEGLL